MKLFSASHIIVVIGTVLSLLYPCTGDAKKVSTRLKAPKTETSAATQKRKIQQYDKSRFERISGKLAFMAYDKKTGADKETFFVDNGSDVSLSDIELQITYYTESGKQIHRRTVTLEGPFPAGETRKTDIKSWDSQKSYHYINSIPSTKGSTPYTVRFHIISFTESYSDIE